MQRHHLLPCQLLSGSTFRSTFDAIGPRRIGFDDFRCNWLLLPAREDASVRFGLPLHRGPHRQYNQMVFERVGQIEGEWSRLRARAPEVALDSALMRLRLLQVALRKRLLDTRRVRLRLDRKDPLGTGLDFAELDAMAERLWFASQPAVEDNLAESAAAAA